MQHINHLLKLKKILVPPQKEIRDVVSSVVKDISGVDLNKKNISQNKDIVFIKGDGVSKNKIFLAQEKILLSVNKKLSVKIKEIR